MHTQGPSEVAVAPILSLGHQLPIRPQPGMLAGTFPAPISLPLGLALGSPIFPSRCEGKLGVALERLSDFTLTFHFYALEKEMATHSSVLAWRIPGTGEPGGLVWGPPRCVWARESTAPVLPF